MRKLIVTALVLIAAVSMTEARKASHIPADYANWVSMPPADAFRGPGISWASDSTWRVRSYSGDTCYGGIIEVADTTAGGCLLVHPVNAPDTTWIKIKFPATTNSFRGVVFDKLHQPRTTTDSLSRQNVTIWIVPWSYK